MTRDDFVFFWDGPFSQWHKAYMVVDDIEYNWLGYTIMRVRETLKNG